VLCTAQLKDRGLTSVRWRLTRAAKTKAHGSAALTDGKLSLRVDQVADLKPGHYVFHVGGRKGDGFDV
jgi:hypothetical protein